MDRISAKLFAAIVPVLVISLCLNVILTDSYYAYLGPEDHVDQNSQVVDFLRGKGELPPAFEAKEKEHMEDVKILMDSFFWVASVLFIVEIVLLIYLLNRGLKILRYSVISTLGSSLLLLISAFFFDDIFRLFHSLFFEPGSWIFKPTDMIVNIYPKAFFMHSFIFMMVTLLVLGIAGYLWLNLKETS